MSWALDLGILISVFSLGVATQWWIRKVMAEADAVPASAGLTGRSVALRLLATAGIDGVSVEISQGDELSSHYDGSERVIRLVELDSATLAAVAVAAHEVGHAAQDALGAPLLRVRTAVAPVAAVTSAGWLILVLLGFFLGVGGFVHVAVLLFAAVAVFHIVTLPVEVQASRHALVLARTGGVISRDEERIVRRVLIAAALTYVAAALLAVAQIFELLFMGEE